MSTDLMCSVDDEMKIPLDIRNAYGRLGKMFDALQSLKELLRRRLPISIDPIDLLYEELKDSLLSLTSINVIEKETNDLVSHDRTQTIPCLKVYAKPSEKEKFSTDQTTSDFTPAVNFIKLDQMEKEDFVPGSALDFIKDEPKEDLSSGSTLSVFENSVPVINEPVEKADLAIGSATEFDQNAVRAVEIIKEEPIGEEDFISGSISFDGSQMNQQEGLCESPSSEFVQEESDVPVWSDESDFDDSGSDSEYDPEASGSGASTVDSEEMISRSELDQGDVDSGSEVSNEGEFDENLPSTSASTYETEFGGIPAINFIETPFTALIKKSEAAQKSFSTVELIKEEPVEILDSAIDSLYDDQHSLPGNTVSTEEHEDLLSRVVSPTDFGEDSTATLEDINDQRMEEKFPDYDDVLSRRNKHCFQVCAGKLARQLENSSDMSGLASSGVDGVSPSTEVYPIRKDNKAFKSLRFRWDSMPFKSRAAKRNYINQIKKDKNNVQQDSEDQGLHYVRSEYNSEYKRGHLSKHSTSINDNLRPVRWLQSKYCKHPVMLLESMKFPQHYYILRLLHKTKSLYWWYKCHGCFERIQEEDGDVRIVKLVYGMALAKDTDECHHPKCLPLPLEQIEAEQQRHIKIRLNEFFK